MDGERACAIGRIEEMIRYSVWSSGANGIVIGVSGGVDSAVSAALCCRAMGGSRVLGLHLPSGVTAAADTADAIALCTSLGMPCRVVPIDTIIRCYQEICGSSDDPGVKGNLMARVRMSILYTYANRENRLVCGTSNRSEYYLGYTTKYGDNAADFQPILHLYKSEVYRTAEDLGIPERIRKKSPSAGFWPGQTDEGEMGISYTEIDAALRSLEANGWKSGNQSEEKVFSIVSRNAHKRLPVPSLL
ncbi:MAG: NAD+ synthase [Methanoregulaceae archaeon]|nr:NAD+ synthase [Methanoregulaceae archaeon]